MERSVKLRVLTRRCRVLKKIIAAQEYYKEHNPNGYIPTTVFYNAHSLSDTVSYGQYLRWLSTPAKRELDKAEAALAALNNDTNINN